jgi:hypothetical protein
MSANVGRREVRPYVHIGWIGVAFFAFGLGLLLGTFGGVFDLYDQVEPLLNSGMITEAQGKAISTVPGSTKGFMFFSAVLALVGLLTAAWAAITYLRRSKP